MYASNIIVAQISPALCTSDWPPPEPLRGATEVAGIGTSSEMLWKVSGFLLMSVEYG